MSLIAGFLFLLLLNAPLCAQDTPPPATQDDTNIAALKGADPSQARAEATARIVLGILSYVRWPADLTAIKLCVVGHTQNADILLHTGSLEMPNKQILSIHRYGIRDLPDDCNAMYAGTFEKKGDWQHILTTQKRCITIGESPGQCRAGGMFCLEWRDGNMSFSVNLDSVARSRMRIHPNVLRLAHRNGKAQP